MRFKGVRGQLPGPRGTLMYAAFSVAIKATGGQRGRSLRGSAVARPAHKGALLVPSGCAVNEAISVTNGARFRPMEKNANGGFLSIRCKLTRETKIRSAKTVRFCTE